jgi:methyl-accepting chemotaxis protein
MKNRRRQYFIDKPYQLRFMTYITGTLFIVSSIVIVSLYFGIWGSILDSFSNDKVQNDLITAARLAQYEDARIPVKPNAPASLSFFKSAEKLSDRQQEIFKGILIETSRKLLPKYILLLFFIAWGTVFLSHKTAGPLYRFNSTLREIEKGHVNIRIQLRKNDEGQLIGEQFNHTLENLDQKFQTIKKIVRENENNPAVLVPRLKEELAKIKTSADR